MSVRIRSAKPTLRVLIKEPGKEIYEDTIPMTVSVINSYLGERGIAVLKGVRTMSKFIKVICVAFAILTTVVFVLLVAGGFCGCVESNYQMYDTVRRFDRAMIILPDGEVVSGKVEQWKDFEDGDQLQIRIGDTWYLVHSSNAVLMQFVEENDGE